MYIINGLKVHVCPFVLAAAVQRRLTTGVLVTLTVSGMLWLSGSTFEDESGTGRGFHPEIIAIVTRNTL